MFDTKSARATLRLAICVLGCGAAAGVWEVLASQAPGSPLYLGQLPGPVQALRELTFTLGLLLVAASAVMPQLSRASSTSEPRLIVIGLHLGVLLALGASLYAAAHGMYGQQLYDLRSEAASVFTAKYAGNTLVGLSLLALGARLIRGR